jgi:opacity protein-like surface antigen
MKFLSLAAASLLVLSATASAQSNVQTRDGFTISFGLGAGSAALTCPGCGSTPRETGASGYLRLGGAISPSLVLSAETNGWSKTIQGVDTRMGSLMGVAQWYPSVSNGFYVAGGVGLSAYSEQDPSTKADAVGLGYQFGTGYDFRMSHNFSLTPYVNFVGMANSDVKVDGTSLNQKIGTSNVQYGIGFTWH